MDLRPGPPCTSSEYWLKTSPLSGPGTFSPLYLRLHGDGVASVVLTALPPKFLRWHEESTVGQQIAIPWKSPEKIFGLMMGRARDKYAWEPVEIREGEAEDGFEWVERGGQEVLTWSGGDTLGRFSGWMACDWVHGHPQLFWITGMVNKPLPSGCERVEIVREWLIPREFR